MESGVSCRSLSVHNASLDSEKKYTLSISFRKSCEKLVSSCYWFLLEDDRKRNYCYFCEFLIVRIFSGSSFSFTLFITRNVADQKVGEKLSPHCTLSIQSHTNIHTHITHTYTHT